MLLKEMGREQPAAGSSLAASPLGRFARRISLLTETMVFYAAGFAACLEGISFPSRQPAPLVRGGELVT